MAKIPDRKNMTTADILAFCRANVSGGEDAASQEAEQSTPEETVSQEAAEPVETPEPAAAPKKPAAKPSSTAEILAAARAAAAGSGQEPKAKETKAAPKPAPKSSGGKPKTTAEILAAARSGAAAGGASEATPAKKPAEKAKKPAVAAKTGGEKPSVQEMLAAFRSEREPAADSVAQTKATGEPPRLPVPPKRPKVKPSPQPVAEERRSFLAAILVVPSAFVAAWSMLAATTVAWGMALVRYGLPNVLVEPPSKFKIGSPGEFDLGTVSTKYKAERGIWVVHTDRYKGENVIVALSTVCTHLGCTPNWLEGEQKFKCPCHGSGFYIDGVNFEGPAPRPLERHGISIAADGMLEVDKSLKFQEEMGQWEDPKSYVKV